jgi:hypothetical protein
MPPEVSKRSTKQRSHGFARLSAALAIAAVNPLAG